MSAAPASHCANLCYLTPRVEGHSSGQGWAKALLEAEQQDVEPAVISEVQHGAADKALERAGVRTVKSPADLGKAIAEKLGGGSKKKKALAKSAKTAKPDKKKKKAPKRKK